MWPKIVIFPVLLNQTESEWGETVEWERNVYDEGITEQSRNVAWEIPDSHSHFSGFNSLSSLICAYMFGSVRACVRAYVYVDLKWEMHQICESIYGNKAIMLK